MRSFLIIAAALIVSPAAAQKADTKVAALGSTEMPSDQSLFIKIVSDGQIKFAEADSEFLQGAARPARAKALCRSSVGPAVKNWVGKISELTTNGDGKGVVRIEIADRIGVKTWNNAISDAFDKTLIDPRAKAFGQLGELRRGDRVKFSGTLVTDETDCFRETSVTLAGSMKRPDYLFRFRDIQKIDAANPTN